MFDKELMKQKIEEKLEGSNVNVFSPRNDNEHFAIKVTWEGFEGKKLLQQHRIVYGILEDEFKLGIHSVSLKTMQK